MIQSWLGLVKLTVLRSDPARRVCAGFPPFQGEGQGGDGLSLARFTQRYETDSHINAAMPALHTCSSSCDCIPETPTAPTHSPCTTMGTPPCTGSTGMLSSTSRPAAMRSSLALVERRDTAALRAFSAAICAVTGEAPFIRVRSKRWPPSSTMAMVAFQLFFAASASQAAVIFWQSSWVRHGLVRIVGFHSFD